MTAVPTKSTVRVSAPPIEDRSPSKELGEIMRTVLKSRNTKETS